jgi:hypothetical protein
MEHAQPIIPADECFRCGYNLLGVADDQACPECGLLAERSRRTTDELHNTRPKWLRSISRGVNLILLSIPTAAMGMLIFGRYAQYGYGTAVRYVLIPLNGLCVGTGLNVPFDWVGNYLRRGGWLSQLGLPLIPYAGFLMAEILLLAGAFLLSRPEGYAPADRADRRLRFSLLLTALTFPLLGMAFCAAAYMPLLYPGANFFIGPGPIPLPLIQQARQAAWTIQIATNIEFCARVLIFVASLILPLLLFYRLRGLAKRARSAHLAEHCAIVGIGTAVTIVVTVVAGTAFLLNADNAWNNSWVQSTTALVLWTLLLTPVFLFPLWSIYLLTRFAISFRRAARELSRRWKAGDRATADPQVP